MTAAQERRLTDRGEEIVGLGRVNRLTIEHLDWLEADREDAHYRHREAVEVARLVLDLHTKRTRTHPPTPGFVEVWCRECNVDWPCPTYQLLDRYERTGSGVD